MQQKISLNKVVFAGIGLTLIIFSIIFFAFHNRKKGEKSTAFLIVQSQENLYQITKLLVEITDNETGSRGFLLTGNPVFLEPLINSKKNIYIQLDLLRRNTDNNPDKKKILDSLFVFINKRLDFSDSTINIRNEKGMAAAVEIVSAGRGKFYTDNIRRKISQLSAEENSLLTKRIITNTRGEEREQIKLLSAGFILVVILMLLLWSEKRRIKQSIQKKSLDEMELLSRQINQSNDAIYTLDAGRKIRSWNLGAEKLYGFSKQEAIGMDSNVLLQTSITEEEIMIKVIELDEADYITGELERKTKSGETIYVNSSVTSVRNDSGSITGYLSVTRDITEAKKLNEKLNHLANIVELSSEAIYSRDTDNIIISWNSGAEKLFGYNRTEVLGKSLLSIGVITLSSDEIAAAEKQIMTYGSWQAEILYRHKNGTTFFGAVTANSIRNKKGEDTSFYFIVKDISQRKAFEEQLRKSNEELEEKVIERTNKILKSEKKYHYLFNNNPLPMWVMDIDNFQFLDVNEMATLHYGYSREEFLSMTVIDIRPQEEIDKFIQADHPHKLAPEKNNRGVWKHLKKNGTTIQVEIHAHQIEFEGKAARLILVNDVTKKFEAAEKLRVSEEQFRYSLDNMLEGVQIVDFDWRYIYLNKALCKQSKYSKEELIGYTMMERYPGIENTALFANCKRCIAEKISIHFENTFTFPDGSTGYYELSLQPVPEGVFILSVDISERKKAEEELKRNEKRFRALIENISDAIVVNDKDASILYQSPSVTKILGYTIEERKGTKASDYMHPDDKEVFTELYKKLETSPNIPLPFQYRARHKNGHYIWLEGVVTNLLNKPEVNAYVANYRDVTKRKELENLLNKAYTVARIGGWEIDLIKGTVYWTAITREIHETPQDYVPTLQSGLDFYKNGPGKELIKTKVKQAVDSGVPWDVELQIITAKNNVRWIRSIGETEFIDGKCTRIYGSFQDIDERKRAEEKIKESEKLYRNLFTNMLNGFCYYKAVFKDDVLVDCIYMAANKEYEKQTGLIDVAGKKLSDVLPGALASDPVYREIITAVLLSGESSKFETFAKPLNKWFSVSLYSPKKGYFVTLIDNITERKQAEEKINNLNQELEEKILVRTAQLKKSNEELEAFSYSVSHDLRAPLRAVIGYTTILEEDYNTKLDDEGRRVTNIIKSNTQKMGNLIDDLLAFSKIGKHELLKTDIGTNSLVGEVISSIGNDQADNKKIKWILHDLPAIAADNNTMRQVWINLISNAVKYSCKAAEPVIEIGSSAKNGEVVFYVKDNGVGFNDKYNYKLFKVFQRLHSTEEFEGTGIGLAIVDKIISKHGGRVWAEAAVNEGATFYFSLPQSSGLTV